MRERLTKRVASGELANYIEAIEGLVEDGKNKVEKSQEEVVKFLVKALADEWLAYYQYWVCFNLSRGPGKADVDPEFIQHAADEAGHRDLIMFRIKELGGKPIFNPCDLISMANPWKEVNEVDVKKMLEITIQAEKDAIVFYKKVIEYVKGFDETTLKLIRGILSDEEEHLYDLEMLLEQMV